MANRIEIGQLKIDEGLYRLVQDEIAPGTGVEADAFWTSLGEIVADLAPKNQTLLDKRDALQQRIDEWYLSTKGEPVEPNEYEDFLAEIGYLLPEGGDFQATTANVDSEIAEVYMMRCTAHTCFRKKGASKRTRGITLSAARRSSPKWRRS